MSTLGVLVHFDNGAHRDRSTTGAIGVLDASLADDRRSGGEIWSLDDVEKGGQALLSGCFRIVQQPRRRLGDFPQVVGWDVGGHADSDAGASVDQQVREPTGQNSGFEGPAVVVGCEVDGLFIDIPHRLHGQLGHPAFGVALGCGRVVSG